MHAFTHPHCHIRTPHTRLRVVHADDGPQLLPLLLDSPAVHIGGHRCSGLSDAEHIARQLSAQAPAARGWIVELAQRPVGLVCVQRLGAQSGELGILIEPASRRRGLAREVIAAVTAFAGAAWQLRRLTAVVRAGNVPATTLFDSLGFARRYRSARRVGYERIL